jgi:hypothetical protein
MSAKALAKLYDQLAPLERISLIVAAEARNDEDECRRLADTAPFTTLHVRDFRLTYQAVHLLALMFIAEQLDALANYWHAMWRLQTENDAGDWLFQRDCSAYFVVCNSDGWRRFCEELSFDPDALVTSNYHGCLLQYCTSGMPANAPSRDEFIAVLEQRGQQAPDPISSDSRLAYWRDLFHECSWSIREAGS